jgi:AcrR family transcriptional regulator
MAHSTFRRGRRDRRLATIEVVSNNTERTGIGNIPRRGRPLSPGYDEAILQATLRLMARDGYARASMDAIAAEAGVTKATIYRRYAGKASLATAALSYLREQRPPQVTDDPRADLVEELRRFRAGIERPHGMAMLGTVLAEEGHLPELLEHFRRDVVLPRRARLRSVLRRARLRPGIGVEAAVNIVIGQYYAAYLAGGRPSRGWESRAAESVLEPGS